MPPIKRQPIRLEDLLAPKGLQTVIGQICKCVDEAKTNRESGATLARQIACQFVRWSRESFGPVPPVRILRRINAIVKAQIIANYCSSAFERVVGIIGSDENFDSLIKQAAMQRQQGPIINTLSRDDSSGPQGGLLGVSDSDDIR